MSNPNVRLAVARDLVRDQATLTITVDGSAINQEAFDAFPDHSELSYHQELPYFCLAQLLYALADFVFLIEDAEEDDPLDEFLRDVDDKLTHEEAFYR